jgi:hypothetical protein
MGAVTVEEVAEVVAVGEEVAEEVGLSSVLDNKRKRSANPGRPSPIIKSLNLKKGSSIKSTCHLPIEMRYNFISIRFLLSLSGHFGVMT